MKKRYYLINNTLFYGTPKAAQRFNRENGSKGIRKIVNKAELKALKELA